MASEVKRLINAEMKTAPAKDYLVDLEMPGNDYFEREEVKRELERVLAQKEPPAYSLQRYEQVEEPARKDDLEAWEKAVEQSHRNLPNSEARLVNLELMKMYGEEQWKERIK